MDMPPELTAQVRVWGYEPGGTEKSGVEGGGGAIKHCLRTRTTRMEGLLWTRTSPQLGIGHHSGAEPFGISKQK